MCISQQIIVHHAVYLTVVIGEYLFVQLDYIALHSLKHLLVFGVCPLCTISRYLYVILHR